MSYRMPSNVGEVRDYVVGESKSQVQAEDTVLLRVTHSNLTAVFPELRLSRAMTIGDVRSKLYTHTGTRPAFMRVFLVRGGSSDPIPLPDDSRMLGYYSPAAAGDTLHIHDDDPFSASRGGWLEDTNLVEKYCLSDEKYAARPDSYVKFRERMRQQDPNWTMTRALAERRGEGNGKAPAPDVDVSEDAPIIRVGDRAEVTPGGKRGVVKYVGKDLKGLPVGWWVGIYYDEPVGKNDGEVKGTRYFTAPRMHGGLARPSKVEVGDFPPLDDDLLGSDDDEI